MKILQVADVQGWAIDTLAQSIIKYNPQHKFRTLYIAPREATEPDRVNDMREMAEWADIIHFQYWRTYTQLAEKLPELKDKKTILTHHNEKNLLSGDWQDVNTITVPTNFAFQKMIKEYPADYSKIDAQAVSNKTSQEQLEGVYGKDKIVYIPYGIDLDKFHWNDNYPPKELRIGYVGRIKRWKRFKQVAMACQELGYKLIFMGRRDDEEYWKEIVEAMGGEEKMAETVEFYNNVPDEKRWEVYTKMTAYVGNSWEGRETGCYDDKTEVLTSNGWKLFKDVNKDIDKIATLNPKNDKLEYQKPIKLVEYSHHKELIRIVNQTLDIAVTKDHNMWIAPRVSKNSSYKEYRFVSARDLPDRCRIKRNCKWAGRNLSKEKNIASWFAFMGIYLAEGSLDKNRIHIAATKKHEKDEIRKILKTEVGNDSFTEYKDGFRIYRQKELLKYLKQFGKSYQKFVPDDIKFASKTFIKIFLYYFAIGDGSFHDGGWRTFYSSSKRLIDDLQELLIKIGHSGNIIVRDRRGNKVWLKDHWVIAKHIAYELNERVKKRDSILYRSDTFIEKYNGKVYCAEVPNHIMLVRRNGKAYFCGNTLPFLEALAIGVPVVTTLAGVAKDIVQDGKNAIVLDFNNPEPDDNSWEDRNKNEIKNKLEKIVTDESLRNKLRHEGWMTVKNMTEQKMAREYSSLYHQVMFPNGIEGDTLVSVVIPTYNRKEQVLEILKSLKTQTYPHIEAIICDDSSSDETKEAVDEYGSMNPDMCIKYLNTKKKGYNLAEARNMGIVEAEGGVLIFCDSRFAPEPDAVRNFLPTILHYKDQKIWLWGDKGYGKRNFVENWSCVRRQHIINAGMFNQQIDRYGGMSQEVRGRFAQQGFDFGYVEDARVKEIKTASKWDKKRRKDIVEMKLKLWKINR